MFYICGVKIRHSAILVQCSPMDFGDAVAVPLTSPLSCFIPWSPFCACRVLISLYRVWEWHNCNFFCRVYISRHFVFQTAVFLFQGPKLFYLFFILLTLLWCKFAYFPTLWVIYFWQWSRWNQEYAFFLRGRKWPWIRKWAGLPEISFQDNETGNN